MRPYTNQQLTQLTVELGCPSSSFLRNTHRTLKIARTIADLAGSEGVQLSHVAEAMQHRRTLRGAV